VDATAITGTGISSITTDDVVGDLYRTVNAVDATTIVSGITTDGIVGNRTWDALGY